MKKIAFVVADQANEPYLKMFLASLRKFHSEEELPLKIIGQKELDLIRIDEKFYKMTPYITKDLIGEYDLILKFDCDQIVCGDLSHIWKDEEYDVGTVYNWNRIDPKTYGEVSVWDVTPPIYYNCGFVVMRSKEFIDHWWMLCNKPNFKNYRYREQDLLNILCYYGNYKVKCFDESKMWHGLVVKGEFNKCVMRGEDIVVPKGQDNFPTEDKIVKMIHWGGGNTGVKMNYRAFFQEPVIERLNYLTFDDKKEEPKPVKVEDFTEKMVKDLEGK